MVSVYREANIVSNFFCPWEPIFEGEHPLNYGCKLYPFLLAKGYAENKGTQWARGHTFASHIQHVSGNAFDLLFDPDEQNPFGWNIETRASYPSLGHAIYDIMDLGKDEMRTANVRHEKGVSFEVFRKLCYLASLTHDIGKAGWEFQDMMHVVTDAQRKGLPRPPYSQIMRHEFLSGVVLQHHPEIHAWLRRCVGDDNRHVQIVIAAAMGHHIKAGVGGGVRLQKLAEDLEQRQANNQPMPAMRGPTPIYLAKMAKNLYRVSTSNVNRDGVVTTRADYMGIEPFPSNIGNWKGTDVMKAMCQSVGEAFVEGTHWHTHKRKRTPKNPHPTTTYSIDMKHYINVVRKFEDSMFEGTENDSRLSRAVKWVSILADVYGSVSATDMRKQRDFWRNFKNAYHNSTRPRPIDHVQRVINNVLSTAKDPLRWKGRQERDVNTDGLTAKDRVELIRAFTKNHAHQWDMYQNRGKDVVLTSSTGSGKTASAFLWAEDRPLFFLTPTTDSASALFFQYGNINDGIRHSRVAAETIEFATATNGDDDRERQESQDINGDDAASETDGLNRTLRNTMGDFNNDVTFACVDQLLGMLGYARPPIMLLPRILSSQIVFDEVHSFNGELREAYMQFLHCFPKLRKAHMTATLDPHVEKQLLATGNYTMIANTDHKPRYRIHWINSEQEADVLFTRDRTLWVHNMVSCCQAAARRKSLNTICYHSRFRNRDRRQIAKRITQGFSPLHNQADIRAVSTQVAEMSLDISAKRLITALCPPEAFIQRLGRVNRRCEYNVADVYVYMPEMGAPYASKKSFAQRYGLWETFVRNLIQHPNNATGISQDELNTAYRTFCQNQPVPSNRSFKTRLKVTVFQNIRDDGYTISALLETDANRIDQMVQRGDPNEDIVKELILSEMPVLRRTVRAAVGEFKHRKVLRNGWGGQYSSTLGWEG